MQDISVIILTLNEEKHLQRCLRSITQLAGEIFVVDCFSSDNTVEIAQHCGAKVIQHPWPGTQARQFTWALENLPIKTPWVLRLDADEYLSPELTEEIKQKLPTLPKEVTGVVLKRRHIFLCKWMKRGTYPVKLLRLFRYQKAVCEQRWMDEHILLLEGISVEFEHDFVDHNLNNLTWFINKHNGYAIREAIDLLNIELELQDSDANSKELIQHKKNYLSVGEGQVEALTAQIAAKRRKKLHYAKQPLFWRSFAYFVFRYFYKRGFLEGKEGFLWHFLQGWWYRTLVDARIYEIKKCCGTDREKIKEYIKSEYKMDV